MRKVIWICLLCWLSPLAATELDSSLQAFADLYQDRFPQNSLCGDQVVFKVCSSKLRNEGNAPYVMHHGKKTDKVVVLFHGLSDSPFYMRPVADFMHGMGINVVVALLPGHGLKDAHDIMLDSQLSDFWTNHVSEVMALATGFGETVIIGGFSTGGALSAQYALNNRDKIDGLMFFSAAFALSGSAESLSKIWGMQWVAKLIEGHYPSEGPNPYKYPSVANSAGIELMEIISNVRQQLDDGKVLTQPIFAVHSEDDLTTPIEGIMDFLAYSEGQNTVFYIAKNHKVCHADIVLNEFYVSKIDFDSDAINPLKTCAVPKANPVFRRMTNLISIYLAGVE